jgi:AcrR family transcriptional regulator
MSRQPIAARREQLIEAAITVASRDGIDAATVRAIAAEAGVSLGVVHYCFRDKDELLSAMAYAITHRNTSQVLMNMLVRADIAVLIQRAIDALWSVVSAARGVQLLSYELTTYSMRHPEVGQVSANQLVASHEAARAFLMALAASGDIEWTVPLETLVRIVTTTVDGVVLAWLADGDDEAARDVLRRLGEYLVTCTRPSPSTATDGQQSEPASVP